MRDKPQISSGNHVEAQDWLEWMLPNFQLYLEGVSFGSSTRVRNSGPGLWRGVMNIGEGFWETVRLGRNKLR
jgi:hypothetical protein